MSDARPESDAEPRVPSDCLDALPLFPLPNVRLFPGALIPLHVFEPRYRALMEWCLDHGGALGLATLKPGYEVDYHGKPPIYEVFGAGLVIASEHLDDGRWNCIVRGTERVRLTEELATEHPFRVARVEAIGTSPTGPDHPLSDRLRGLVGQLAEGTPWARETLNTLLARTPDVGRLADIMAAHTVADADLQQALLEAVDISARLDQVCDHLSQLVMALDTRPETLH